MGRHLAVIMPFALTLTALIGCNNSDSTESTSSSPSETSEEAAVLLPKRAVFTIDNVDNYDF